ncbi:MAG TPA: cytochrome c oxidase subunit II [Acidimicrobiales bacterium]|jgi:cytochrome c oxidase subunit 2|nr:cytochrome c oxidase subunit II [Acidimicrobiales bacterium]
MTRRTRRRAVLLLGAPVTGALLAGCNAKAPSMLHTKGSEASSIAGLWWLIFALGAGVYLVVAGFIVWALLRGRRGSGEGPVSDDAWIVWGGIGVPMVILAVLAVATVRVTSQLRKPQPNALKLEVVAKDWWWYVKYSASGVTTSNEIHLPAGQPVEIGLDSDNVIHSFWVPQLAGKLDVVPGQHNVLRFTPETVGVYRGECAEFCGVEHARMGFLVIVEPPTQFATWIANHAQAPSAPDSDAAALGEQVFMREPCAGCHTIRGTQAQGLVGPDLTNVGGRRTLAGDTLLNTPSNLANWISDAQRYKPGALMPPIPLSPTDLNNVVAYLEGLK